MSTAKWPARRDASANRQRPSRPPEPAPARLPGTSLHRQLYLSLRDRIVSGVLKEGRALPTEEALCEEFQCSRITVRRALADLEAQGFVQRRHGLGTFVLRGATGVRARPTLSFIDELRQQGSTDVEVLSFERGVPPPDIAGLLQLADGDPAIHAVRARSAGGIPLMHTNAWVPADVGKAITRAALKKKPMYQLLGEGAVRFGRVVQEIGAVSASPELARVLATEAGAPLLRIVRLLHDAKGRPVQHLTVHLSPERSHLLMEIRAEDIDTLNAGQIVHDALLPDAG